MTARMLVTGGTGYLGRVVAPVAATRGWLVDAPGSSVADVRNSRDVLALVRSVVPDVVVHTAYVKDTPDARAVIEDGSANVALAALDVGARLIHMSTDVVFDGRAGRPYRELDAVTPSTDYGRAKARAEQLVAGISASSVIVRTSLIYGGPNGPESPHERAARDPQATFYANEVRCPVQVHDLAAALVELADSDFHGILHVAGPAAMSRQQFAAAIAGKPVRGGPAPDDRPLDCRLDTSLAASLLTISPRSVSEVWNGAR
jgi:dTDP-4-dehydrorhamnose reductase